MDDSLEFISTEAMIGEIKRRSKTLIVVMVPLAKDGEDFDWATFYEGDAFTILGLYDVARAFLLRGKVRNSEPKPRPDDEPDEDPG